MHVLQLKYHNQMDKSIHYGENFFIYMKKLKVNAIYLLH